MIVNLVLKNVTTCLCMLLLPSRSNAFNIGVQVELEQDKIKMYIFNAKRVMKWFTWKSQKRRKTVDQESTLIFRG